MTRFCEQPGIPTVGGTKNPDVAAIVALAPDLVVVNEEENRREDADALEAAGVPLHVTRVRSVADVQPFLTALARVLFAQPEHFVPPAGHEEFRLRAVRPDGAAPRVFVPIWRRPWMTLSADTYGSSVLDAVGLVNVFADDPDRYPTVTLDDAAALRPDLVLAPSEPYPFRHRHLDELRAVGDDVRLVDGKDLFWWGVRTAGALERLAQSLARRS